MENYKYYFVLFTVVVVVTLLGALLGWALFTKTKKNDRQQATFCFGFIALCGSAFFAIFVDYSQINYSANSMLVDDNDNFIQLIPDKGYTYFSGYGILKNKKIVSFNQESLMLSSNVNPITSNPKVINFAYSIKVEYLGSVDDWINFQKFERRVIKKSDAKNKTLEGWIKYQLREFNTANSKALALYQNPESETQLYDFKLLITSYFKPLLKNSGIRIKKTDFSI